MTSPLLDQISTILLIVIFCAGIPLAIWCVVLYFRIFRELWEMFKGPR